MINKIIFLLGMTLPVLVIASEHGSSHEAQGIPTVVLYQALNVTIIIGLAIYFGKQKIVEFFNQKRELFLQAQEKAQGVLRLAENEHHEVKTRLDKLKNSRIDSIAKAKVDANELRAQLLQNAKDMAKKLGEEAQLSAKMEFERAKLLLKEQMIKEAFELSRKDLISKATKDDQKKLYIDFISKVKVIQ